MEMPTPCQKCGETFDLNDGYTSEKWFPNTVICVDCHHNEVKEIEYDEAIDYLKEDIETITDEIESAKEAIQELKEEISDNEDLLLAKNKELDKLLENPIEF